MIVLSHLLEGFPGVTGGESMLSTSNTIATPPQCTSPGSESQATSGVPVGTPGPVTPLPPENDSLLVNFETHPNPPDPYSLTQASPGGWDMSPNEAAPGRASRPDSMWKKV